MATKNNDKVILELRKQIETKKKELKASERFNPITNCSLEIDGVRYNLHVLDKNQIIGLLVKLNCYKLSFDNLGLVDDFVISGYNLENWIKDLNTKLMNVNRRVEEERLKNLENKLYNLLSLEKKVELEIDDIASQI